MADTASPPQGWYVDPSDQRQLRWWDGSSWTAHTSVRPEPSFAPPVASDPGAGGAPGGRRRWWVIPTVAVGAALVVIAGALVATRLPGSSFPSEWDPEVVAIAQFDEQERGLEFAHPVEIVMVPEDEFAGTVQVGSDDLTDEDERALAAVEAQLRSFGLIDADVDLLESSNDLQAASILAYYDSAEEKVYVRGTELTPAVKVTLAHELVHVLQDQNFDLDELTEQADDPSAVRALVEGDATRVEQAYLETLSDEDRASVEQELGAFVDDADQDSLPDVLVALSAAPYTLGAAAAEMLYELGGNQRVDAAYNPPPTADIQILDPARLVTAFNPEELLAPSLPPGAEVVPGTDDAPIGAIGWYLVLSRRLDIHRALDFADAWAGDATVSFEDPDGTVCSVSTIAASTPEASGPMLDDLTEWLAAGPPATDDPNVFVRRADESTVELGVCDPGERTTSSSTNALDAIGLLVVRYSAATTFLSEDPDIPIDDLRCLMDAAVSFLDAPDLAADADEDAVQAKIAAEFPVRAAACA